MTRRTTYTSNAKIVRGEGRLDAFFNGARTVLGRSRFADSQRHDHLWAHVNKDGFLSLGKRTHDGIGIETRSYRWINHNADVLTSQIQAARAAIARDASPQTLYMHMSQVKQSVATLKTTTSSAHKTLNHISRSATPIGRRLAAEAKLHVDSFGLALHRAEGLAHRAQVMAERADAARTKVATAATHSVDVARAVAAEKAAVQALVQVEKAANAMAVSGEKANEAAKVATEQAAQGAKVAAEKAEKAARVAAEKAVEKAKVAAERLARLARAAAERAILAAKVAAEKAAKAAAATAAAAMAVFTAGR